MKNLLEYIFVILFVGTAMSRIIDNMDEDIGGDEETTTDAPVTTTDSPDNTTPSGGLPLRASVPLALALVGAVCALKLL